jgi:SNF2 family DNA or RNA helicase
VEQLLRATALLCWRYATSACVSGQLAKKHCPKLTVTRERLQPVMVRRLKADVLDQLPSKQRQRIHIEVGRSAATELQDVKKDLESGAAEQDPNEKRKLLMQLYKATCEAKIPPVCEYISDLLQGGCKRETANVLRRPTSYW